MTEQNINSDLIRGHIDTIILKILLNGDNYGYEIMKAVSINSNNEYELKEPSLYTSLKRLEKQGHIISYWGDESKEGAEDISGNSPRGIAVAFMIDCGGHARGEIILMTQRAVKRNAQGFLRYPSFAYTVNIV